MEVEYLMRALRSLFPSFYTLAALLNLPAMGLLLYGAYQQLNALQGGCWWALGNLGFYLILFTLFITRAQAKESINHPRHWIFALLGTFLPFFMMTQLPDPDNAIRPTLMGLGFTVEAIGIIVTYLAICSLGRGFGILAANRVIKTGGMYRVIRHPLYCGEALWFLGIIILNMNFHTPLATVFNLLLFCGEITCQTKRMVIEETLLSKDATYKAYLQRVKYRLLPGIF